VQLIDDVLHIQWCVSIMPTRSSTRIRWWS